MVDRAIPGACADDRGVLLQPARRRPARHRRPAAEDVMEKIFTTGWLFRLSPLAGRGRIALAIRVRGSLRELLGQLHARIEGPPPPPPPPPTRGGGGAP